MIYINDTRAQYETIKDDLQSAITGVMEKSYFILGENVEAFEREFAEYCGTRFAVGVGNGTDAIQLACRALGIGPGDEVVTTPHTATFSALGISMTGATPTFADVEPDTGNIDPLSIEKAITKRTKALMPVHLYGQVADMEPIRAIAGWHGIPVIEDAAQAHGATYKGTRAGALGLVGCFSFYPTKNLGAYGDGGAVTTNDPEIVTALRELRNGGQKERYNHVRIGVCSRLDEMQAAILRVKLPHLEDWNQARREKAALYDRLFAASDLPVQPLTIRGYGKSARHLYVIKVDPAERDALREHLAQEGFGTAVHYPQPVHLSPAYSFLGLKRGSFPVTETLADSVVTLPLYPEITGEQIEAIVRSIAGFYARMPARQ